MHRIIRCDKSATCRDAPTDMKELDGETTAVAIDQNERALSWMLRT